MPPKKLLLVDDETEILTVLRDIFEEHHWDIHVASNGVQAIEICRTHDPSVIISDIQMPDMDGLTLLDKVYSSGKDTPVILITAYRDAEKMQRAWESCVYDFVDKPFQSEKILAIAESAREFGSEYVKTARKRFQKIRSAKPASKECG